MRTAVALLLIAALAASSCARPRSTAALEESCPKTVETPNARARFIPATRLDTALTRAGHAELVVFVRENPVNRPLADASVVVYAVNRGVNTDDLGVGRLQLPAGTHQVRVRRLGYKNWADTVHLRAGYADTLHIGLGLSFVCLQEVFVGPRPSPPR